MIFYIAGGIALFLVILFIVSYKKAPPNTAMVVTGPFGSKTFVGKGCFVIPFIQRQDLMTLQNIQVDFMSKTEIPTQDAINIMVDAVANVSISKEPEIMKIAASKFLGFSTEDIANVIQPVLEGNIREIISQVTLKDLIHGDKKQLAEKIVDNVTPNLKDMGLDLTTFNIQSFKDKNGVIDNLGIENTVAISKDAAKSKAAAESEVKIAQAEADRAANDARVAADTEIAEKQNLLNIRKAELKKESDTKLAEAEAAKGIQAEAQRKTLEITTAEANLARQEKQIVLSQKAVEIKERQLEAEIEKQADAEKYAAQQKADAELYTTQKNSEAELFQRQKNAEAEKFEAEKQAEAKKALAESVKAYGEAEAAALAAKGRAEAEALAAKGKAEAESISAKGLAEAEAILKKAEAMKQYGDAAKMEMQIEAIKVYFEQLPAIAEAAGKAYQNVDGIYMYGGQSTQLMSDVMQNISKVSETLGQTLGIDLKSLVAGFVGGKIAAPKAEKTAKKAEEKDSADNQEK